MFIPNSNVSEKVSIKFIRKMVEMGQSYYAGIGHNEKVIRFKYKNKWINYIDLYRKGSYGILPELKKVLEGAIICNDARTAHAFMNMADNEWKFIPFKNLWYKVWPPPIYSVTKVEGENIPPYILGKYINPWCMVITNNHKFSVSGYRLIPQFNDGLREGFLITRYAHLIQKWDRAYDACEIIDQIQGMIEMHHKPISVIGDKEPDAYLESIGWKVIGKISWSGGLIYMPAAVAHNANR